ncbi:hypothetical protein K2X33_01065 [bacterium]|nr:hypothetical protein [bacterium]
MGLTHFTLFEGPAGLPGVFDSLFGGLFLVKGIPLAGQLGILWTAALSGWWLWHPPQKTATRVVRTGVLALLFTLFCLFLLQPWDEVFINLRHAWNWAQTGRFSFNQQEWIEGTAEFLPYWIVGVGARVGLPVVDGIYYLGIFCALGCLWYALRFWAAWGISQPARWGLLLVCFPPLAYNASHGFAAAAFLLTVLASLYHLCIRKSVWGWVLLGILPLVRVEGALLSLLLWSYCTAEQRTPWRRAALTGVVALGPALVHALIRHRVYGEWFPIPVYYKSTLGSPFFLMVGLRNLAADLVATHTLAAGIAFYALRPWKIPAFQKLPVLLALLGLFCVPYYLSGGDWFPSYWGRYLLPFSFFLWVSVVAVAVSQYAALGAAGLSRALAVPVLFFLFSSLWPISSTWKFLDQIFSHRRTLAMIHEPTIGRAHFRVQNLSKLGTLLGETSDPQHRIGSSELATIMFFAHRDAVDYLGLVNPEIARSPLRELPSLVRRFPFRSELPYLIFRRLRPDWLEKTQPEFLYTFDFMLRDQIADVRPYEATDADLVRALGRWDKQLGGLMDPLYGGLRNIQALGYEPVMVRSGEDFIALYFVHQKVRERHFALLKEHGYHGRKIDIP